MTGSDSPVSADILGNVRCLALHHRGYSEEGRRDLPYMRADRLEQGVWEKVKEVLNNSDQLTECINRSVTALEKRRKEVGARSMDIERRLETVRARTERLGMAFTDGAIGESTYKSKLKLLKKEEIALMKSSRDFDLTDVILKDMIIPSGTSVKDDHREKQEETIRHRRAILQLFNIKVIVYPERIEIMGTIPSQVLDKTVKKEPGTAPIISSPSPYEAG